MRELNTFSGRRASQHPDELGPFIDLLRLRNVTSYLEIGARHGDTFYEVMMALPPGSLGVAVDLPGGAWGTDKSVAYLKRAGSALSESGYRIRTVLGDSTTLAVRGMIERSLGPVDGGTCQHFDAVLIDGDHRYDGVKADWEYCRTLARLVAFHDIAGAGVLQKSSGLPVEVPQLWNELKGGFAHRYEFVARHSTMGIGAIVIPPRDAAPQPIARR